jgi:putative ABC transport system permease protein
MKIPVGGYLAAFLWLTGGTLLAVQTLTITGRLMQAACGRHPLILLAASRLRAPTSRHQLALSGCFVAIGMAAATAFLIGSFERTVTDWLEHRLKADIFISSAGFQGASSDQRMPDVQIEALAAHPAIADLDVYRGVDIRFDGLPVTLGGSRFTYLGNRQELLWLQKPLPSASRPAEADTIAYANENFLNRTGFGQGSVIQLTTPAGDKKLWIAGIHADYARDNGSLLVDIGVLKAWYQIDDYATAGAFLVPGTDREAIKAELQAAYPGLNIRNNAELKEAAMRVFEQTFAVTKALQLIGLFVALTGLSLSLLSLLRESGRELSLQSTLGMRRQETALACALEGSGIAAAGLLSGGVLSFALGWVLIHVINKQSFGWTLQTAYPWGDMATLGGAIIFLGCATSYATGRFYLKSFKRNQL